MSDNQTGSQPPATFDGMSLPELRGAFYERFGHETKLCSTKAIRGKLVYREQEMMFGGLSDAEQRILDKLADGDPMSKLEKAPRLNRPTLPGTRLRRVWKGEVYEVTAAGDGMFEYDGKHFKSLSAIAREITGTQWNGKIFFGVKK